MITAAEVLEAEFSLIASVILDPRTIERVGDRINADDFGFKAHGKAWQALCDFKAAGGPCGDSRQVIGMFVRLGLIEALGGAQRLKDIQTAFPHNAAYYASIVLEGSQWRRLDNLLTTTRRKLETDGKPADVAGWARVQLESIVGGEVGVLQSIGEAASEALESVLKARIAGGGNSVKTGLYGFDKSFGGMAKGELVLLAARPSIGKTALAVQIAMYAAKTQGGVMLASLEMQGRDLALRMMAKDTKISVRDLRCGQVVDSDVEMLTQCVDDLKETDVNLLASRNVTPEKIRAAARIQANTTGLALVVVDYIGLVKSVDPKKPTYERVSETCAAMKDLALELDVPVLCLSQLNRVAEKERPGIHHLRDSGNLEQDADVIWLLHRETRASRDATVQVAKARQGATGEHVLAFEPATTTFSELGARDMPNYETGFAEYEASTDDWGM